MLNRWTLVAGLVLTLALLAAPARAGQVRISAASSLTEAVNELCRRYGAANPEVSLVRNFAASGTLAKQIAGGAPADLFVSADPVWMDYLVAQGKVPGDGVRNLAANALVVVGRRGIPLDSLEALTHFSRIAIGSPKSVPAGAYAERALQASGIYERLQRESRLVIAKDVRQALMYAERGDADAAFVYRTDARLGREVTTLYEVPQELLPAIVYPAALTAEGVNNRAALDFFAFLGSGEAAATLESYGFLPGAKPASP